MKSLGQSWLKLKGFLMLGIWIVIAIAGAYIIFTGFSSFFSLTMFTILNVLF